MKTKLTNENLSKELQIIEKELLDAPKGRLVRRVVKGKNFYSEEVDKRQNTITKDKVKISKYARKMFLKKKRSIIIEEKRIPTPKEIISKMSATYKYLPINYFFHPTSAEKINRKYNKNSLYPDDVVYSSNGGSVFRSKSERDIANSLEQNGLLYHYEPIINLTKLTVTPDFIVINPFNGKVFIWEHFGAINQDGYIENMSEKMDGYLKEGYIEGESLIATFEYHIWDVKRVQRIIEKIVL